MYFQGRISYNCSILQLLLSPLSAKRARLSFLIFLVLTKSDEAFHSHVKLSMSLIVAVRVANQLTSQPPWAYWEVPGYIVVRIRKEES